MELTKEQIQEIDNYVSVCGIKYYDVKAELVDHFASILEKRLESEPKLIFSNAIAEEHRKFSNDGFKKLLETKTKEVQKQFYIMSFKHFKGFFKLPKIILTGIIFYLLYQVMNLFENKEDFFNALTALGFLFIFLGFFSLFIKRKKKKEVFLKLNMNQMFFQGINNFVIIFNSITIFRTSKSFLNPLHNGIQLTIYVLAILFLISAYNIYSKNKKEIKNQYPNVFV